MRRFSRQLGQSRQFVIILMISLFAAGCTGAPPANNGNTANNGNAGNQQVATSTPIPTAPSVARPTFLVQRGDVQEDLTFTGRWQPRDQTQIAFQIAGTVRRVNVKRGDTVTTGQLLADYQITQLEDQLATAKLSLETAKANLAAGDVGSVSSVADAEIGLANAKLNLEKTKQGSPWPQVASAKLSVESAKDTLASAQRAYDDAISRPNNQPSAIDSAYDALVRAQNGLKSAQNSYDSAAQNWSQYQFQIASAENALIQAELGLEKARRGGADPAKAQAVTSAQLNVSQIEANIKQSSLYAPSDGEVLEVNIKPGDAPKAFDTVIVIGKPEPKEAVASLAIGDAQKLSVGLVGVCQVVNRADTAVQCVVRRIPLSAREADQTTRVAASLEGLTTGQLIEVTMPLQVRTNVLWLPPTAVRTFQNRTFVVLQTPDGQRVVDVEVGLRTEVRVELKSGVKEGDVVIGP
jgi:HlyD family secretion protein